MTRNAALALTLFITFGLLIFASVHFNLIHLFQEWRYGRKVDETVEWEAFTAAFKDEE